MKSYNEEIVDRLKKHDLTFSICESVTGGMISSNIVSIPGSSAIFCGGCISYTEYSKTNVVRVSENTIKNYGVVSAEVAKEMALGVQKLFKTDISIGITGDAGPKVNGKIGLAFLAVVVLEKIYTFELLSKEVERNDIRLDLTIMTFKTIVKILDQINCK